MNELNAYKLACSGHTEEYMSEHIDKVYQMCKNVYGNDHDLNVVAILHDYLEDVEGATAEQLLTAGFSCAIVEAVEALTRKKGEDYNYYLYCVSQNALASKVKKIDIICNILRNVGTDSKRALYYTNKLSDLLRLSSIFEGDNNAKHCETT